MEAYNYNFKNLMLYLDLLIDREESYFYRKKIPGIIIVRR